MTAKTQTLLVLGLLTLSALTDVRAQNRSGTITGSVVDAETGEPLPGATLQVEGRFIGTITNDAGDFSLSVPAFPATLAVRFIGYQSASRTFTTAPREQIRFALQPSTLELPEIVVTGENPAINIMRHVIEEKQRWRATMETYKVNAYNRFRLENDSGIVSIWESSTLAFWDRERGIREISLAQKQTENMDIDEVLPAALFMNNLYDDNVEVAGHTLMGVTHPDALSYYEFELTGTRAIDDRLVYDIAVKPRSKLGSGFVGAVAVLDSVYALLEVDLKPGASFLFPPPIKNLTVSYRQQFSRFGSDVWLPVDLRSSVSLDLSFGGLLSFPTFHIAQSARLSDFELNIPVPDSLYENDDVVVADSALVERLKTADLEEISIPLTADETRAYETIDSTMTMEKAFKPRGLLARFVEMSENNSSGNRGRGSSGSGSRFLPGNVHADFSPELWFNPVEGWHLGGSPEISLGRSIELRGLLAYQSARKAWSYGGTARIGRRRWLEAGYRDQVAPRYESPIHGRFLNTVNVLALQPDYFDYLHQRDVTVSLGTEIPGLRDADATLTYRAEIDASTTRRTNRTLFGTVRDPIPNAAIADGTLQSITLELGYENDSVPYGIGGEYRADIAIERSIGGSIVEADDFTRLSANIVWRIPTFFRRRLLPNALDLRLAAGTYTGTLPRQRFGIVDGSTLLSVFGGLRTRLDRPYEGASYMLFAAEHSFRTVPFELLGLRAFAQRGWNLLVTGAVARTWTPSGQARSFTPPIESTSSTHSEVGVSLSGLFGVLRIDFTKRLDASGTAFGMSVARIF